LGSENANIGIAKLQKMFLAYVIGTPNIYLYISITTEPHTMAVDVAIAGVILPAFNFIWCLGAGFIE